MDQITERGYKRSKEPGYTPQSAPPADKIQYGRKNTGNIISMYLHVQS